jgi:hypothetical protein
VSGYVLVLADRRDLGADHLVVALAELDADVVRVDPADFPQRVKLEAHLDPAVPSGWRIALRVQGDTLDCGVRADLLTGIYQGRTDPYRLPADLAFAERRWAHQQAHAGFGGLLAACEPAWLNHPRHVLHATLLPVQLAAAEASGLAVPPTVITNITGAARAFARGQGAGRGAVLCRAVSPATLPSQPGEPLHVAPTAIHERQLDDSVRATAHLFQHQPPGTRDARLLVLDGQVLPAADVSSLPTAPGEVTRGAVRTVTRLGLRFAELRFAVAPDGTWTFQSCDPSPDLWELDEATGPQTVLAVAHALSCFPADGDPFQPDGTAANRPAPRPQ